MVKYSVNTDAILFFLYITVTGRFRYANESYAWSEVNELNIKS